MPKKDLPPVTTRGRGRPKGQTAKVAERTKTLREMAQIYAPEALNVLARIAMDDDAPPAARVSASNSLLDRGYGRPAQAEPTQDDTPDQTLQTIRREIVDPVKKKVSETEKTG